MNRTLVVALLLLLLSPLEAVSKERKETETQNPYGELVWPPPPDRARIQLAEVFSSRADIEAESRLKRVLIGASPQSPYDRLVKPFAVAFDSQGRILVTDSGTGALVRFDRDERRLDVFGTKGVLHLERPLGIGMGPDDTAFVADAGLGQVLAFGPEGKIRTVYGRAGELSNPTDVALSPAGDRLFVADSKGHEIVVFDTSSGEKVGSFGRRGEGQGEFSFPTSLAFSPEGDLLVVDQMNSRVQVLSPDGDYLDEFGGLGIGFGNLVRPKDVAVSAEGLILVTDNAFNNVQLFDADLALLTFVGQVGDTPGRFHGASGVAVRGEEFAVVDQLGARLQVFRFLELAED